jgi:hypothetical protein
VRSEGSVVKWERAWRDANGDSNTARTFLPVLLENPEVAFVAGYRDERLVAGAIGRKMSEGVLGWSNFFAAHGEDTHVCESGSVVALSRNSADAAIVGYEEGEMLRVARSLSFEAIGPLRPPRESQFRGAAQSEPSTDRTAE